MNNVIFRHIAWVMAFGVGFLSLSQEILWIRVVGFVKEGVPQSFALVLTLFLLGVALGAVLGRKACTNSNRKTLIHGIVLIAAAGLSDLMLPWMISWSATHVGGVATLAPLIVLSAALKAALFPVAHHLGSEANSQHTGRTVSRVYFMNIAGSTLGPLLTGFVLLDHFSTQAMFTLIGVLGVGLAALLSLLVFPGWSLAGLITSALLAVILLEPTNHSMVRALASGGYDMAINRLIENRQGILHTVEGDWSGDVVYGGNVYDGRVNTDLLSNSNRIDRMYLLAALHPAPQRVLVIGLSAGAWTKVLSSFPTVKEIEVVEINPGYIELIRHYPAVAPILNDSKIRIHIDDGRRWLRNNPDQKFDLVIMNTSFHWRAYITNLLAFDFLQNLRNHLAPGGIVAFNATGSIDAFFTATQVFPHAYRWSNFVYAAEHDFRPADPVIAAQRVKTLPLRDLKSGNEPWDPESMQVAVDRLVGTRFHTIEEDMRESARPPELVTLQNMKTEYKHGRPF